MLKQIRVEATGSQGGGLGDCGVGVGVLAGMGLLLCRRCFEHMSSPKLCEASFG